MNYQDIKQSIDELIQQAEANAGGAIIQALAPLREDMLRARQRGVKLRRIYDLLIKKGFTLSPSSFQKYAQSHLQIEGKRKLTKRRKRITQVPEISKPSAQDAK